MARYSKETKTEAVKLRESGLTYQEISDKLGCSKQSVYNWCKKISPKSNGRIDPIWVSPELVLPNVEIFRYDKGDHRFYYQFDETFTPKFYLSVTTLTKGVMREGRELSEWKKKLGERADEVSMERADYGTILHILAGDWLLFGLELGMDELYNYILDKVKKDKWMKRDEHWVNQNLYEWHKDLLAFGQWYNDYEFEPIAIEIPAILEEYMVAGCIDLVGFISLEHKGYWGTFDGKDALFHYKEDSELVTVKYTDGGESLVHQNRIDKMVESGEIIFDEVYKSGVRKGAPKECKRKLRVLVIVDIKSGRKGFYDGHQVQLEIYRMMWADTFPGLAQPEKIFNWSPKDWRLSSGPSYNFTDQTDKYPKNTIEWYLNGGLIKRRDGVDFRLPRVTTFAGHFRPGSDPNQYYVTENLTEAVSRMYNN